MDKVEDILGRLQKAACGLDGYSAAVMDVWGELPEYQMYKDFRRAADLIQSQQALIEEMREALFTISGMSSWQCGVPIDTEAANEHARIASEIGNIAGVAAALSQKEQADDKAE